jgi:hypothetical protein
VTAYIVTLSIDRVGIAFGRGFSAVTLAGGPDAHATAVMVTIASGIDAGQAKLMLDESIQERLSIALCRSCVVDRKNRCHCVATTSGSDRSQDGLGGRTRRRNLAT